MEKSIGCPFGQCQFDRWWNTLDLEIFIFHFCTCTQTRGKSLIKIIYLYVDKILSATNQTKKKKYNKIHGLNNRREARSGLSCIYKLQVLNTHHFITMKFIYNYAPNYSVIFFPLFFFLQFIFIKQKAETVLIILLKLMLMCLINLSFVFTTFRCVSNNAHWLLTAHDDSYNFAKLPLSIHLSLVL